MADVCLASIHEVLSHLIKLKRGDGHQELAQEAIVSKLTKTTQTCRQDREFSMISALHNAPPIAWQWHSAHR